MAEFLSPAWISELDDAARASDDLVRFDGPLVLEQIVQCGSARPDVRYQIRIERGRARVVDVGGDDERADIVLLTDVATARALHTGARRTQDALAAGALKIRGNPDVLVRHRELLGVLDRAFATARARTTFAALTVDETGSDSTGEQ
ncbi:MAG TPA: SCP2 sterol-binding domain-containing protein [Acidimicrobiia bacterium]